MFRFRGNNRGFTMVELIAVIAIVGAISGTAIPAISNSVSKNHKDFCESQINTLRQMAQEYYNDYQSLKPKQIGDSSTVTLEKLVNEKYTNEKFTDYEGNNCNQKNTKITVLKTTNNNYEYNVNLDCNKCNGTSGDLSEKTNVKADITYTPNSVSDNNNRDINVRISFNDNGVAIYSYKYEIHKIDGNNDTIVGGTTNYKKYSESSVNVKLSDQGVYKIVTTAINAAGNKTVKESGLYNLNYKVDNSCPGLTINAEYQKNRNSSWRPLAENKWEKGAFKFEIKKTGSIYSYDVFVSIDGGAEELIINKATVNREINYDRNSTHTYEFRIVGYDEKGNSCTLGGSPEYKFVYKQDNEAPSCWNSGGNGSSWLNSYANPNYVEIVGHGVDAFDNNNSYRNSGIANTPTKRYYNDTDAYYSPGTVYDNAGNSVECPKDQWVRIDKTKPNCRVTGENTGTWLNLNDYNNGKRVKVKGTCSDRSSRDYYSGRNNRVKSGCEGETANSEIIYGDNDIDAWVSPPTIKDKAGNIGLCTRTLHVMVDKHPPVCNKQPDMTSWKSIYSYDISTTCKDGTYNNASSGCTESYKNMTATKEGNIDNTLGSYKDNAGNTVDCGTTKTLIDHTAPTCYSYATPSNWTSGNVQIVPVCSDNSGVCFTPDNKVVTSSGYYEMGSSTDQAGNSSDCGGAHAYIDNNPPTCLASGTTLYCYDNESGCSPYNSAYCPYDTYATVRDNVGHTCTTACESSPPPPPAPSYSSDDGGDDDEDTTPDPPATPSATKKRFTLVYVCNNDNARKNAGTFNTRACDESKCKTVQYTITNNKPNSSWLNSHGCTATVASKTPDNQKMGEGDTLTVYLKKKETPVSNTKFVYTCRHGNTYLHWRTSTSCARTSANAYNCARTVDYNTKIEVYKEKVGTFYRIVSPQHYEGKTLEYIKDGCVSDHRNPADCPGSCQDH